MSKTSQKWGQKSTEIELKSRCLFSKCFHGPKREPKKPLNKGLQGDFVLFELRPSPIIENIFVNICYELFSSFNSIFYYLLEIHCSGSKMVAPSFHSCCKHSLLLISESICSVTNFPLSKYPI